MRVGSDPDGGTDQPRAVKDFFKDSDKAEDRQVVVVGAGPAGSTTARYAAEAGIDVLLIDRKTVVGSPVQCAGFIPSEGELSEMLPKVPDQGELYSIDDRFLLARTYESAMVTPKGRSYTLRFEGRTVDRAEWDPYLVDLAVKAGAEFRPSTQAIGVENGVLTTDRGNLLPGVIVAADGPNSRIRTSMGMPDPKLLAPALNAPSKLVHTGKVEMHFCAEAPSAYAWVIPAGQGIANIGLGVDPRRKDVDLRANLRAFAERVGADLGPITGGFVPSAGPVKRSVKANVMLVGDSAGHVMASNGGGVPIGLAAGRIAGHVAARVVKGSGSIKEYEREWKAQMGEVLGTAARFRWLAGMSFWSPLAMEMAMWAMPKSQMLRALKCQRLFWLW
jgi:digeranylgeranylglycerophospholipid reductase